MQLIRGEKESVPAAEEKIITTKGNVKHVIISAVRTVYNDVPAVCSIVSDVTGLKESQMELQKTLDEKNTLFQELHHRIKNNLQLVSSLMEIQSQSINHEEVKTFVKATGARIRSMSEVHNQLLRMEEITDLDVKEYLQTLVKSLVQTYCSNPDQFPLHLNLEERQMHIDKVMTIGLLTNEVISNMFKHAYADKPGPIHVSLNHDGKNLVLKLRDEGQGLLKSNSSTSSGMSLISLFAKQLGGELVTTSEDGVSHTVTFPID